MQQKTRSVGASRAAAGSTVDPELLQESLFNVLRQTAESGLAGLEVSSAIQQRRAARLNEAARTLGEKLGQDHPRVLAVQTMAKSAGQLNARFGDQVIRSKKFSKLRPYEWGVFGTVSDKDGKPAGGLIVRVFDLDRKYDDLLGETETDEHGDFSIVYHERDFKESNENLPELYVMVSDAKGSLLYTSRDNIRFNAGQVEYFIIKLGELRAESPKDTPRPGKTRVAKKQS